MELMIEQVQIERIGKALPNPRRLADSARTEQEKAPVIS